MLDYISGMLESLDADMDGVQATPAASHLFSVNGNAEPLESDRADSHGLLVYLSEVTHQG